MASREADALNDWLLRVERLRRWTRNGERAPHKPLLLLYMLGRLQRGLTGPVAFTELETPVAALLRDFGPVRKSYHPEFPFHQMVNDGLWVVTDAAGKDAHALGTAVGRLRAAGAVGRLQPAFERGLVDDPTLLAAIARTLLDANFAPPSTRSSSVKPVWRSSHSRRLLSQEGVETPPSGTAS